MTAVQKQTASDYLVESLCFAGYSSPESALETWCWAFSKGDTAVMLQSATTDVQKELRKEMASMDKDQIKAVAATIAAKDLGYRILKRELVSDDDVILHISTISTSPSRNGLEDKMKFRRIGNEWKMAGRKRD